MKLRLAIMFPVAAVAGLWACLASLHAPRDDQPTHMERRQGDDSAGELRTASRPDPVPPAAATLGPQRSANHPSRLTKDIADIRTAVYGNPYKAVVDAIALSEGGHDALLLYVYDQCRWVRWLMLVRSGLIDGAVPVDAQGKIGQALVTLESQCQAVWQDQNVRGHMDRAVLRLTGSITTVREYRLQYGLPPSAGMSEWTEALFAPRQGGDPKYVFGSLWAGLDDADQYNRAVRQAFVNLSIDPGAAMPHLQSLLLCADTGACGVAADKVAVHDLPAEMQDRVLAAALVIQRQMLAGNRQAFDLPPGRP